MYPIIDTHCHIYPDKIADKAVKSIGEFYSLEMRNGGSYKHFINTMNASEVTHSVVFSVATKSSQVKSINKFISDIVSSSNGKLTGLGTLHLDCEDIYGEIDDIIAKGLKGIKFHPDIQAFEMDCEKAMLIYEACQGRLPILFHCGDRRYDFSNPNRLKKVLEAFPSLQVIGAHFGGYSVWEEAADELYGYDNLMVDTSSSFQFLKQDTAKKIIRKYSANKIMFASDFPMWNPADEIKCLNEMKLSSVEYEKIYYKNAQRIFDINV